MEFTTGQVFNMENFSNIIKKSKEKKLSAQQNEELLSQIDRAKNEISVLKSNLEYMTDKEAIESSIYRLKAAELEFNRHIKAAKTSYTKG